MGTLNLLDISLQSNRPLSLFIWTALAESFILLDWLMLAGDPPRKNAFVQMSSEKRAPDRVV